MKTINYNNQNLYCSVELDFPTLRTMYNSAAECFEDHKEDIISDCVKNEYNESETNAVLSHYKMIINNANGKWEISHLKSKAMKNLLANNDNRCFNYNCDIREECARFKQLEIDKKNKREFVWGYNFEKIYGDPCQYYIDVK